jgi:hypothetical protein
MQRASFGIQAVLSLTADYSYVKQELKQYHNYYFSNE